MDYPFYRPSFSKHLHSLARSNYFSRRVDADDLQFLEYVKRHGVANGNLPNTSAVLLEELEFWHFPYSVAPGIERHIGKRPPEEESQEARSLRQARSNAWHARRIIRDNERAIADAELAREQREWEVAQTRRKVRELISDAEWEAAAPEHARFGATVDRHHVPEWKLQELGKAGPAKPKKTRLQLFREAEWHQIVFEKQEEERKQALERARVRKLEIAKEKEAKKLRRHAREARQAENNLAKEQARKAQILAEARAAIERVNRMEREWRGRPEACYTAETLTQAIMTLLNRTPGHVWMGPEMARALGCTDVQLMNQCLDELVRSGRLRTAEAA